MPNSLIEELPKIVAQGKKEAQRILDGLSKSNRITLQTNELVLPTKATGGYFGQPVKTDYKKEWFNRVIYGDNPPRYAGTISREFKNTFSAWKN